MGPIGLMSMCVAKAKGARCIASELSRKRLELASSFGADLVVNPGAQDLASAVSAFTGGRGADIVIDAAGFPSAISQSIDLVAQNGVVGNICFGEYDTPVDLHKVVSKNISIVGSRLQTYQFQHVIDHYSDIIVEADRIITDIYSIDDGPRAFELFGRCSEDTGKILIEFN